MNLQEIIDAITADPPSDEALTAIRDMASQNERLTADNERLTNELTSTKTDLENSRKAYRERFMQGPEASSQQAEGRPAISSLFKTT